VWVDATYLKARQDGRVASVAVGIAVRVKAQTGEREVLEQIVGATICTVFAQPDAKSAHQQWRMVSEGFRHRFSRLSAENAVALKEKPLAQAAPHKSLP
jgi:hypothetical protein